MLCGNLVWFGLSFYMFLFILSLSFLAKWLGMPSHLAKKDNDNIKDNLKRRSPFEFGEKWSITGEDLFFWSSLEFGEKSVPFLVKNFFLFLFFFGLLLICSPEKNRGRRSSPPMLKIGQN